jgi:DNA polymerase III subunit gamma/tau
MGFLSLYRKYRPRSFNDLVGQDHIVRTLKNALENNRIAHAYLFAGPRGTGKTSTAKVFAKALNCVHGPTAEPCGECDNCRKIQSGQSIDVIEIDAASNRGIDEIRDLREKIKYYPTEGKYKVYIIDEVHMLTKGAFNALLKTLEEPPENVVFILATTEPHQVIGTILSRCQRFDFSLLSLPNIISRLKYICQEEDVKYSEEALQIIAHSSNGGLRDAISLLDQAISYTNANLTIDEVRQMLGKVDDLFFRQFFEQIIDKKTASALEKVNQLINGGYGIPVFINDLIEHVRQLLLIKECGVDTVLFELTKERLQSLEQEARKMSTGRLINIIEILTDMEKDLNYSDQPQLIVELGIVKMTYENKQIQKESIPVAATPVVSTQKVSPDHFLTLDQVSKAWPDILKEIKSNNISVHAYLIEGKPVSVENNTISIKFGQNMGFHKKGAEQEEDLIKRVINKVLKQSCQLYFEIDGAAKEVAKKKEPERDGNKEDEQDLLDRVLKLFDGEIVKVDYNILGD